MLRDDHGTQDAQNLRWGAGAVGDVNKDRPPEYVVGAPSIASEDAGSAVVYDGATGDRLYTLTGDDGSADFGWYFFGSAGDAEARARLPQPTERRQRAFLNQREAPVVEEGRSPVTKPPGFRDRRQRAFLNQRSD